MSSQQLSRSLWRHATFVACVIVFSVLASLIFQPSVINGASMTPTLSNGDHIVVNTLAPYFHSLKHGDVIVFYAPCEEGARYVKRIVGLPGERMCVEHGTVLAEDTGGYCPGSTFAVCSCVRLGRDEYFVLGDNRECSLDSRVFGPITYERIIGRVMWLSSSDSH